MAAIFACSARSLVMPFCRAASGVAPRLTVDPLAGQPGVPEKASGRTELFRAFTGVSADEKARD